MGKTGNNRGEVASDYEFVKSVLKRIVKNDEMDRSGYESLKEKGSIELISRVLTNPAHLAMALGATGVTILYGVPILLRALPPQLGIHDLWPVQLDTREQGLFALAFCAVLSIPVILAYQVSLHGLHVRKGTREPLLGGYLPVRVTASRFWKVIVLAAYILSLVAVWYSASSYRSSLPAMLMASWAAGIHLWSLWKCDRCYGRTGGLVTIFVVSAVVSAAPPLVALFVPAILISSNLILSPVVLPALILNFYNLVYLLACGAWVVVRWFSSPRETRGGQTCGRREAVVAPEKTGGSGEGDERRILRVWIWNDLMPAMASTGIIFLYCLVVAPAINSVFAPANNPIPVAMELEARNASDDVAEWGAAVHAKNGDVIEFQVRFENPGDSEVQHAMLAIGLPDGLEYEQGTARVCSVRNASGEDCGGLFDDAGADIGNYASGDYSYVRFKGVIKDATCPSCLSVFAHTPENEPPCVADARDVSVYVSTSEQAQ